MADYLLNGGLLLFIAGFCNWLRMSIQAFPRVSSLIKTKEGTGKGVHSLDKNLNMSGELIEVVGKMV